VAAAQAHGVTVAQVVVRWHVQHDVVVIPKSKTPDRIAANIDVDGFVLTVWGVRIRAWVADQR
jgi:2,5-diketo-D-gluconate reductase A